MTYYTFILFFSFGSFMLQASSIKELKTEEEGLQAAALYMKYNRAEEVDADRFMHQWNIMRADSNYYFLASFEKEKMIGFLDFYIFPSLYHGILMRIDSIYLEDEEKEKECFSQFRNHIDKTGRETKVSFVIANTNHILYPQEERFFTSFMKKIEGKRSAYGYSIKQ